MELGLATGLTTVKLGTKGRREQLVVAVAAVAAVHRDEHRVSLRQPGEPVRRVIAPKQRVACGSGEAIQHARGGQELTVFVRQREEELVAHVGPDEPVGAAELLEMALTLFEQREGGEMQAGGPALGAPVERERLRGGELEAREAQQRRRFRPRHRQLAAAQHDRLSMCPQAGDRHALVAARHERQLQAVPACLRDRRHQGSRLLRMQDVEVVEDEHDRHVAAAEPPHEAPQRGGRVIGCPRRQRLEDVPADRLNGLQRKRNGGHERLRVVVRLVEGDPGEWPWIAGLPFAQQGRLAVAGRRQQQGHGHVAGIDQPPHEARPRDQPGVGVRELRRAQDGLDRTPGGCRQGLGHWRSVSPASAGHNGACLPLMVRLTSLREFTRSDDAAAVRAAYGLHMVGVLGVDDQVVFLEVARDVVAATPGFRWVGGAALGQGGARCRRGARAGVRAARRAHARDGRHRGRAPHLRSSPRCLGRADLRRGEPGHQAGHRGVRSGHPGAQAGVRARDAAPAVDRPTAMHAARERGIGIVPITVVPVPSSELTSSLPPTASMRSRMLSSPAPGAISPAANPAPSSRTSKRRSPLRLSEIRDAARLRRVLRGVLHRLDTAEVGRRLNLVRVAVGALDRDGHRHEDCRAAVRRASESPRPARRDGYTPAASDRSSSSVASTSSPRRWSILRRLVGSSSMPLGELEPDPKRHEALLAAVVQSRSIRRRSSSAAARMRARERTDPRAIPARAPPAEVLLPDETRTRRPLPRTAAARRARHRGSPPATGWCRSQITVTRRSDEGGGRRRRRSTDVGPARRHPRVASRSPARGLGRRAPRRSRLAGACRSSGGRAPGRGPAGGRTSGRQRTRPMKKPRQISGRPSATAR